MMVWLGLYYATTELRLCNAYSLESQLAAGKGLVVLGSAAGAAWLYYGAAGRFIATVWRPVK